MAGARRGEQVTGTSRLGLSVEPPDQGAPRVPAPPGRGRGAGALVAGIVALACAGGLWFAYRHVGPETAGSGDIPIIRADKGAVKVLPENPGGDTAPDEDNGVYTTEKPNEATEHLLPPPEAPMPKPAPTIAQAEPPPAAPVPAASAPPPTPAPTPQHTAPAVTLPQHPAPPPPVAAATPKPPPVVTGDSSQPSGGGTGQYRVQIAATKDDESAHAEWSRLQTAHPDLLGSLPVTVVRADLGDRGVFYRLQAGAFDDRAGADKLCAALKAISIACLIVRPH